MNALQKILARAQAKAQRKASRAKTREESGAKFQREERTKNARKRENALRRVREKSGFDIAQSFVEEVAPFFHAMMQRDDASKLEGFHITFRTSKTDQGPYSAQIRCGSGPKTGIRNFPNGSIANIASKHGTDDEPGWLVERLLRKLETEGGVNFSTRADCLEEILRLRQLLKASDARIKAQESERREALAMALGGVVVPPEVPAASDDANASDDDAQEEDEPANAADTFDVQLPLPTTSEDDVEASTEEAAVASSDVPVTS